MKRVWILILSCGSFTLFSHAAWAVNPASFFSSTAIAANLPIDVADGISDTRNASRKIPSVAPQAADSGIDLDKLSAAAKIDFQKFKNIITSQANANYSSVGADGGLGKYNIQLAVLRELGYTGTVEDFLRGPNHVALQEYAINAKIVKDYTEALKAFGNDPKKVLVGMFAYDYSGRIHIKENVTDTQQYNHLPHSSVAATVQAGLKKYYGG